MRVVSLNINCGSGLSRSRADKLEAALTKLRPDVLLLQELSLRPETIARLGGVAARCGLKGLVVPASNRLGYGSAIASRWDTRALPPLADAPFPELLVGADIVVGEKTVRVFSVHMPNGSNHGWKKIESFEAMLRHVREFEGDAIVIGGDFNEPVAVLPSGEFCSVAGTPGPAGVSAEGTWSRREKPVRNDGQTETVRRSFPRSRWQAAIVNLLQPGGSAGLVHAYGRLHGSRPVVTHVNARAGTERFFDHIVVSPGLSLLDAGYDHSVRARPGGASDHSAAWVIVET
jgi:endonuclease/exonuclease/phosphatase family metal-dependent hydrolase